MYLHVFFIALLVIVWWSKPFIQRIRQHYILKVFPGPKSESWLYGNLAEVASDRFTAHQKWLNEYGKKEGIVRFTALKGQCRLLVTNPDVLKQILSTNVHNYHKSSSALEYLMGDGLLFSKGDTHDLHKAALQPVFSFASITKMMPTFIEKALLLSSIWEQRINMKGNNMCVNMLSEMDNLTLDILAKTVFGFDLEVFKDSRMQENNDVLEALQDILKHFESKPNPLLLFSTSKLDAKFQQAVSKIQGAFASIVRNSNTNNGDLISALLITNQKQSGIELTEKQIFNHAITFFIAGHDTASSALSWAFEAAFKHPQTEAKILQEISGFGPVSSWKADDILKMQYTTNFMKEVLRVYPPIPVTVRSSIHEDTWLGKYKIPANTFIIIPIDCIHNSSLWKSPEQFSPERFNLPVAPLSYLPFLAGGRSCIGHKYAMEMCKVVLAILLSKFRVEMYPGHKYRTVIRISARPSPSLFMNVSLRT